MSGHWRSPHSEYERADMELGAGVFVSICVAMPILIVAGLTALFKLTGIM